MNKIVIQSNRLKFENGKAVVYDNTGKKYTRFNYKSRPSKTEVLVGSFDNINYPKKKTKKRRLFGR